LRTKGNIGILKVEMSHLADLTLLELGELTVGSSGKGRKKKNPSLPGIHRQAAPSVGKGELITCGEKRAQWLERRRKRNGKKKVHSVLSVGS